MTLTLAATWSSVAPMPEPKTLFPAATGGDGRIYVFGGTGVNGPPVNDRVYAYDPRNDSWSQTPSMPLGARRNMAAATDTAGRIYVIGGYNFIFPPFALDRNERFDPATQTWAVLAPMPTARQEPSAATGPDGRIYVMGGVDGSIHNVATTEAFNPATNTWTTVKPMSTPRVGFAAVTGTDGRIYVFGGYTGSVYTNSAEVYDTRSDTWTPLPSMIQVRFSHAGALGPDGRIYAIAGSNGVVDLPVVEVFDLGAQSWAAAPSLSIPRSGLAAATANGKIYAVGGSDLTSAEALSFH